jgi:hypothetical protein
VQRWSLGRQDRSSWHDFIDSSGLRAVVVAKERTESHGTTLSIVPGPTGVMRVFELVGLLEQIPFEARARRPKRPCSGGATVLGGLSYPVASVYHP